MNTNKTYNGWYNYATWRLNLEIFDGMEIDDAWDFRTLKEAKWSAEVNGLHIRATGYKAPLPLDPYITALAEVGECLL